MFAQDCLMLTAETEGTYCFPASWKDASEVNCGSFTIQGPSVELREVPNMDQDPKRFWLQFNSDEHL